MSKPYAARLINIDVYDMEVSVFFSAKDADRYFKKTYGERGKYYQEAFEDGSTAALASRYTPEDGGHLHILILPQMPTGGQLAHEILHLIDYICETLGIPLTMDTSEPRGYLMQYLFDTIYDVCKEWGQENPEWHS